MQTPVLSTIPISGVAEGETRMRQTPLVPEFAESAAAANHIHWALGAPQPDVIFIANGSKPDGIVGGSRFVQPSTDGVCPPSTAMLRE
ncbi:hypothetical protein AKJ09_00905 [Labilithrix luteola]|uniref:Uncharacterized protein n=1 Tax=Labilithrix luteola TaxID=1391654 RepID=A0A0K1PLH8_9BACT|nr:hypothetical protein AKJ09_00905 [Labilithrix luteola]